MTTLVYKYKSKDKKDGLWLSNFIESEGEEFKVRLPDNGKVIIGSKEAFTKDLRAKFRFSDFANGIYSVKVIIDGKLYTSRDIHIKSGLITPLSFTNEGISDLESRINRLEEITEQIGKTVSYLSERVGNQNVLNL